MYLPTKKKRETLFSSYSWTYTNGGVILLSSCKKCIVLLACFFFRCSLLWRNELHPFSSLPSSTNGWFFLYKKILFCRNIFMRIHFNLVNLEFFFSRLLLSYRDFLEAHFKSRLQTIIIILSYIYDKLKTEKRNVEISSFFFLLSLNEIKIVNYRKKEWGNLKRKKMDTHPAFTYGTLLKRCGKNTSTMRRAPIDGTRHCMYSRFEVIFVSYNFLFFFYLFLNTSLISLDV